MAEIKNPMGICPYCGHEQELNYPNIQPFDSVHFFTTMEDPVITDSFNEVEEKSICKECGKIFHFIHDLAESLYSKKHNS